MKKLVRVIALLLISGVAHAHGAAGHHHMPQAFRGCSGLTQAACGLRPTPAFDAQGRLWLSWVDGGHVYVSHSDDLGKHFSPPVAVNRVPEPIEATGESRAKIAIGKHGEVFVSYTRKLAKRYSGEIRFSRSLDGGEHFSDPVTVNDNHDVIGHRFDTLWVTPKNRIYLVWIDKRDREAARKAGRDYPGAAIYYAISDDAGKSFGPNHKLGDNSCECCRIALAGDGERVYAVWRNIFGKNTRDHVVAQVGPNPTPIRVSVDDWQVDACPHHGPAMDVSASGTMHLAWYTQGSRRQGSFYARLTPGHQTFSHPLALGSPSHAAGHASIASSAKDVYVAWREFDGKDFSLQLMQSADDGAHWSAARQVAKTAGDADYPFLLSRGRQVYLAWQTRQEGYRLFEVSP